MATPPAAFDPDAYLAQPPQAFDPDAYLSAAPAAPASEVPGPRSFSRRLGASAAGLADTVLGIVPQAIAETGYAGVRALESVGLAEPGRAQRGKEAFMRTFGTPVGSAANVTQTPEYRGEASQQLMQFIGENVGKGADWLASKTGIPKADIENMIFTGMFTLPAAARTAKRGHKAAAPVVGEAVSSVVESAPVQTVLKPLQERAAKKQEARVASSFENAATIDAANLAVKHGIIIDPVQSNPTIANRLRSGTVKSTNFAENAAKVNDARFTQLAKEDMGLSANTVLDAKAFDAALDQKSAPYDAVRSIPVLVADEGVLAQIDGLRITRPAIGGEAAAKAVNSRVNETIAKIKAGRSGAEIVNDIRKLRRDANAVYTAQQKSGVPDPVRLDVAETNKKIASALESLIDANVSDPKLLSQLRQARTEMAKIYDYERATNFATNRIDPSILGEMVKENAPLSGIAADIGKIAQVFPDIAKTGQTGKPAWSKGFTRSGAAGTAGLATAALFGAPLIPGAVAGATIGYVGGGLAARRMASPAYQARYAVPPDFRPPVQVNNLRPAPPSTTPNLPVPYDYRNALLTQDQIPNWVFGQNIPEGGVRVETPSGPMLGAPSAESTMRTVEQRRAFDYQRQKAEAEAAAARQAQSEAAGRAPTSGEVVLELDPVTGKLRSTSQGMKGATPEVLASTGRSLESASQKIASGQKFALSAEERIAWEKTRVDLSVIDAGLGKLSDKALAEKAMDRAWVEETIAKARQKAKAFEEIEKRAKDAQQANRARAERERLMDVLETLEPQLSRPRATSVKEQGPKTREAIRNRLAPGNQNNLRND